MSAPTPMLEILGRFTKVHGPDPPRPNGLSEASRNPTLYFSKVYFPGRPREDAVPIVPRAFSKYLYA